MAVPLRYLRPKLQSSGLNTISRLTGPESTGKYARRLLAVRSFTQKSTQRAVQGTVPQSFPLQPTPPVPRSVLRRFFGFMAIAIFFTGAGFTIAAIPAIKTAQDMLNPPSDEETLGMYEPEDEAAREVERFIQNHPVAQELRSRPEFIEARPHLKIPPALRAQSLTAGTLMGPGKVVVPPYTWSEKGGKSMVSIAYLGQALCGHPGIVHGGFLATMLDEGLARCCFAALPNKVGVTANLNINYRKPAAAGNFVVLRATTTKVEGRKAWVEGRIETLVGEGETPVVLAEATALFIEPKYAASMARIYPVT